MFAANCVTIRVNTATHSDNFIQIVWRRKK